MLFDTINEMRVCYRISGEGNNVVLLHGWGAQKESFAQIHQYLEQRFRTCSIDLPGFGRSDPPKTAWDSGDYAEHVKLFFQKMEIHNPIIIGHSFGGRIAIRLALSMPVRKLVLVNSAGIRPRRHPGYYLKVYSYKAIKNVTKLPLLNRYSEQILQAVRGKLGSSDYQNASGVMRETLIKAVNEDLKPLLAGIPVSTLLIWGENDRVTPLSSGKLMERLIPDAGLVVLSRAGHFSYLEKIGEFKLVLDSFLQNDVGHADA